MRYTPALAVAVALAALPALAAGPWRVPDPAKVEHPGTDAAPASSPATYPDEDGFQRRTQLVLVGLVLQDLSTYRRGYFSGGDPGKYVPGYVMARLLRDPAADAVSYMNDERSFREHYHFAAINWARYLPLFGDTLSDDTQQKLADAAFRFDAYLTGGGTENHKTMWMTSANVLPHYLAGGRGLAHRSKDAALAEARGQLERYVRGLYAAGAGEWDSPTYLMFTLHGLLNIYDFSPDEQTRAIAKAGLDWCAAYYALKYTGGLFAPPNQRGYYDQPFDSIADQTGYLWWGGDATFPLRRHPDDLQLSTAGRALPHRAARSAHAARRTPQQQAQLLVGAEPAAPRRRLPRDALHRPPLHRRQLVARARVANLALRRRRRTRRQHRRRHRRPPPHV